MALYTYLTRAFLAEAASLVLWIPVWFGLGIILYFQLPFEPHFLYAPLATIACSLACFYFRQRYGLYWILIYLFFACAGITTAQIRTHLSISASLVKSTGPVRINATIEQIELTPRARRVTLSHLSIPGLCPERTPTYVRLNGVRNIPDLITGDRVSVTVILRPFEKPVFPGSYSFTRDAYFKQLGASGFATSPFTLLQRPDSHSPLWYIGQLRRTIMDQLFSYMKPSEAAIASALLMGDQGAILKPDFEAMRDSGLAHLLSVSGMHLTQVALILFFTCRLTLACIPYFALHYPIKQWSAVFAIAGSLVYLILTDMPVPAVRAFMMTSLVLCAMLLDRKPTPLRSLALSAFCILLLQPEAILTASFQMSFAAVIALISAFEWMTPHIPTPTADRSYLHKFSTHLMMLIVSSLIAGIATAPFTLYHFHQLSTLSILGNLVAIPLTSIIIMPLAILSLLAMLCHIPTLPLYALEQAISLLLMWANYVSDLPYASIRTFTISSTSLALFCVGGLWLCLWQRSIRWFGVIAILASIMADFIPKPLPDILIDSTGKTFALRSSRQELVFFGKKPSAYLRQQWEVYSEATSHNGTSEIIDPLFACDTLGCTYTKNGKTVAISLDPVALVRDCKKADAVVNLTHQHVFCPNMVMNRWKLWKYGAHTMQIGTSIVIHQAIRKPDKAHIRPWERHGVMF